MMINCIVLIGLMGCGKTTVGQQLAQQLNWQFVDTDVAIEKQVGLSVADIFAQQGEPYFRQQETITLTSLLTQKQVVIATGGGIVTLPNNRTLLRKDPDSFVVYLQANIDTLIHRIGKDMQRPLLHKGEPHQVLTKLLTKRAPFYQEIADITINVDGIDTEIITQRIVEKTGKIKQDQ